MPLAAPETAKIVNRPRIFGDPESARLRAYAGRRPRARHAAHQPTNQATTQDLSEIGLAEAPLGNGILLDIRDPINPKRLDHVSDKNFAYWHSATFNNDGTKIIFTDEWGGGTQPRCRATDLPSWGANAIFDIVDNPGGKKMVFAGYYKMPAPQTETENCVAHNGSLVPVPGRDIMVQGWYQGGVSVFDFTDSANPVEIAYCDSRSDRRSKLTTAGYWSTYWYNGHIYGAEIARGSISSSSADEHCQTTSWPRPKRWHESVQRAASAGMSWPATTVVGRAYLDQLTRAKAVDFMTWSPESENALAAPIGAVRGDKRKRGDRAWIACGGTRRPRLDHLRDRGTPASSPWPRNSGPSARLCVGH